MSDKLEAFELLESEISRYHVGNRTSSIAFLAWFLESVWRMEPEAVSDAICDGGGDKGIDALAVDDDLMEITVFQSKRRSASHLTQGDADLRTFVGVASYFREPTTIDALLSASPNAELRNLLIRLDIRKKLEDGEYSTRLVFLTNAEFDSSATGYLASHQDFVPRLDAWDRTRLADVAMRTRGLAVQDVQVTVPLASSLILERLNDRARIAVMLVSATELVRLPGIENRSIFELNVRLSLGRNRINKELSQAIDNEAEHEVFPAYHNGLTLLTKEIHETGTDVELNGVSVVNGCQSLVALYENRNHLTPQLKVLVKVVELGESLELVDEITYRTNNQNPVNARDLRSTDPIQRDLQEQVRSAYGSELSYVIRSGETPSAPQILDNGRAAQLAMAVYLKEPWNAVRKVRLFDEEYHRIFGRRIDGHKLYLLFQLDEIVSSKKSSLRGDLESSFSSVRFTFLHLLTTLIGQFELGEQLLDKPELWMLTKKSEVIAGVDELADDVADALNFYIENRIAEAAESGNLFDPKTVFKSKLGVQPIEQDVIQQARRSSRRDASYGFHLQPEQLRR